LTNFDAGATISSKFIDLHGRTPMLGRLLLHRRLRAPRVEFCEACASVCDARCRSDAVVDRARTRGLSARGVLW